MREKIIRQTLTAASIGSRKVKITFDAGEWKMTSWLSQMSPSDIQLGVGDIDRIVHIQNRGKFQNDPERVFVITLTPMFSLKSFVRILATAIEGIEVI